jgi:hypothetical protein
MQVPPTSDPAAEPPATPLATLGEDLILLSVRPGDGKLLPGKRLAFGLAGAELARLAVIGRITVTRDEIIVVDPADTGQDDLDELLERLAGAGPPPHPATWIGLSRADLLDVSLNRLVAAGTLSERRPAIGRAWFVAGSRAGTRRFTILATGRAADAGARLDTIARSGDVSLASAQLAQLALGGLAAAIGLPRFRYPGRDGRPERDHLAGIATRIAPAENGKRRPAEAAAEIGSPDARTSVYAISWATLLAARNLAPRPARTSGRGFSNWTAIHPPGPAADRRP